MKQAICQDNCLEVYAFADFHDFKDLKKKAKRLSVQEFDRLWNTDELLELSFTALKDLIISDELDVSCEEVIYESILRWLNHDYENRNEHLTSLLLCIRFPLINPSYIKSAIIPNPLISENTQLSHMILQVFDMITNGSKEGITSFESKKRFGMSRKNVLVFSGGSNDYEQRSFLAYDPESGNSMYSIQPHDIGDLRFKIENHRLVVTERNQIFFIGGLFYDCYHYRANGGYATDSIYYYNQYEQQWRKCAHMPEGRCSFGVCAYGHAIYVFGGYHKYPNNRPMDTNYHYDIELNSWSNRALLPFKVAEQAVCVFNDSAYAFGGKSDERGYMDSILQYKFDFDQWTVLGYRLPFCVTDASAITQSNQIFILGGMMVAGDVSRKVLKFTPNTEKDQSRWCYGTKFPEKVRIINSIAKGDDDNIYVLGGFASRYKHPGYKQNSRKLFKYNTKRDIWESEITNIDCGYSYTCCMANVNVAEMEPVQSERELETK